MIYSCYSSDLQPVRSPLALPQSDNYIFRENSWKVDEHFSLFFVKISRKLRSHFLVIFRENMVHNKASLHNVYGKENL